MYESFKQISWKRSCIKNKVAQSEVDQKSLSFVNIVRGFFKLWTRIYLCICSFNWKLQWLFFTWTLTKHEFSHDQSCKNATIFPAFFSSIYHELSGYVSYISLVFYTLLQEVQCTMAIFCLVNQISFIVPSWKTVQEYQLCLILKQLWPFLKPFLLIRTYFSLVNTKYIYMRDTFSIFRN